MTSPSTLRYLAALEERGEDTPDPADPALYDPPRHLPGWDPRHCQEDVRRRLEQQRT